MSELDGLAPVPTVCWRIRPTHPERIAVTCDDAESSTSSPNASTSKDTARTVAPEAADPHYKKRNTVERAINRLKGFRAVATRYEKRAYIYLGTVTLAALTIWLRT